MNRTEQIRAVGLVESVSKRLEYADKIPLDTQTVKTLIYLLSRVTEIVNAPDALK